MVQINWTIQAKNDLKAIADYISKDSVKYAKLQVIRIRKKSNLLILQIYTGRIVPELNQKNIRELIEGNYRIIYKIVNDKRIDILTVHHSARELKNN